MFDFINGFSSIHFIVSVVILANKIFTNQMIVEHSDEFYKHFDRIKIHLRLELKLEK